MTHDITTVSEAPTMGSREIAELCGKRHDHVIRDIEKMFKDIGLGNAPKFGGIYLDSKNREKKEYHLPKDLTMTLITGYRIDLRYKVIKRLEELEARAAQLPDLTDPKIMLGYLQHYVKRTIALEQELEEVKAPVKVENPKPAALPRATASDYLTVGEVAERWRQSDQTVRNICHRGELRYLRSGRKMLIQLKDVKSFEASQIQVRMRLATQATQNNA